MAKTKQFVVIGLGRFGRSVAKELHKSGYEVLAIDRDEEVIQDAISYVTHAVQADVTDEEVLKSLGIRNFDVAIIAIGSDIQASIMATLLVKEMGVKYVLAKSLTEIHAKVLDKIGADKVVFPEKEMGIRTANNLMSENIIDSIEVSSEYSIVEVSVLPEWIGKTLQQLDLRSKCDVNVMALKRGKDVIISPDPQEPLQISDVLLVIAAIPTLAKLNELDK